MKSCILYILLAISLLFFSVIIWIIYNRIHLDYYEKDEYYKDISSYSYSNRDKNKKISSKNSIPKTIITSVKSYNLEKFIYKVFKNNQELNPDYEFYVFDDIECLNFIKDNYGQEYVELFEKLIPGAYKSDFFRYLYMYKNGGIWLDINKQLVISIDEILDITEKQEFLFVVDTIPGYIYQAFFYVRPKNKLLKLTIQKCIYNIVNEIYGTGALEPTGPKCIGNVFTEYYGTELENSKFISAYNNNQNVKLLEQIIIDVRPFDRNQYLVSNKFFVPYYEQWERRNIYKEPDDYRVDFYLGDLVYKNNVILDDNCINADSILSEYSGEKNNKWTMYEYPLKQILEEYNYNTEKFLLHAEDTSYKIDSYTLVKARRTNDTKACILFSLGNERHWDNFYNPPIDDKFEEKDNKLVWRGATTGSTEEHKNYERAHRYDLFKKWGDSTPDNMDIAFSICVQDCLEDDKNYLKYMKKKLSVEEMLKHKYILSIEGNDKDSGLQWKLNSNSVVFMPKPHIDSWLMESKLKPDIHYILIKNDFSDLKEKIEWCDKNQTKCKQIIQNAHSFMDQFRDREDQKKIEKMVLYQYFKRTTHI